MKTYILTRERNKKQPLCGYFHEEINGIHVRRRVDYIFEPQKAIHTDADMSAWVDAGIIVCIDSGEDVDTLEDDILDETDDKDDSLNNDDETDDETDDEDKEKVDDKDIDLEKGDEYDTIVNDDKDDIANKYKETAGGFRCIYCGKVLKSEKRMITHVIKHGR